MLISLQDLLVTRLTPAEALTTTTRVQPQFVGWPLVAALLAVALYYLLIILKAKSWQPWIVAMGEDGRLSTSKFQFFLWTGVVIFVYTLVFAARTLRSGFQSFGYIDTLPQNVLTAMGGSALTAAFAQSITGTFSRSGRLIKKITKPNTDLGFLVTDDEGNPDLGKIQILCWTFLAAIFYVVRALTGLSTYAVCDPHSSVLPCFPDIDNALMGLMLLGQGGYLATKLAANAASTQSATNAGASNVVATPSVNTAPQDLSATSGGASNVVAVPSVKTVVQDLKGPVIAAPQVQAIFWGTSWMAQSNLVSSVVAAIGRLLVGPYLARLKQYRNIGMAALQGKTLLSASDPPNTVFSTNDVASQLKSSIESGDLPTPSSNMYYSVFMPDGFFSDSADVVGDHSFVDTTAGRAYFGWVMYGTLAEVTRTFSHELVEACTDPDGTGFQVKPPDPQNWNEICDACEGRIGNISGVTVQAYWSESDNACVVPGAL